MYLLRNQVMNYAWGSHTAIAGLEGRSASVQPEAEVWMGAHPKASSGVVLSDRVVPLTQAVAESPAAWLGSEVVARYGATLPFLFKVLAAGAPLSLQAHPSIAQARAGYDAEDARGIPVDAPHRNYRDRNHKPELICALTRFEALCGFRARDKAIALFHELNSPTLTHAVQPLFQETLSDDESAIRATFAGLMRLSKSEQQFLCAETLNSLPTGHSPFASSYKWARRLEELYPGDVGMVVSLLLNQVTLQPGQALYLPAGNLHAYLEGLGVELMANSDNVLRGGCTPKHVDVEELLAVLTFRGGPIPVINPAPGDAPIQRYITEAEEFELSRVRVSSKLTIPSHLGPRIVLAVEGEVTLDCSGASHVLRAGESAYLLPGESIIASGDCSLFVAAVGSV
jgi:mannose-6-phosphate isomerase